MKSAVLHWKLPGRGWDDSVSDIETRVRTALAALEQSGYLIRGNNVPHVYATGITVKNMDEARKRISMSLLFDRDEIEKAVRIIKSLISQKHIAKAQDSEAESRIDYLADILGISKREVISVVERMRQEGILADSKIYLLICRMQVIRNESHKFSSNALQNLNNTSLIIFPMELYEYHTSN